MKQSEFYKYATWGLLVLNLAMISFFFLTKPPHPGPPNAHHGMLKEKVAKLLDLDEQQNAQFLQFAKEHQQKMQKLKEAQQAILQPYFQSIVDTTGTSNPNFEEFYRLERQKVEVTYAHFQEVKSMLKEEQQDKFANFMDTVLKRILLKSDQRPHPPQKF